MPSRIHPAHAVIVRADTPISEALQTMIDHRVGSVLIVNDRAEGDLAGIFTERDLLKNVAQLRAGDHWSNPIRTVMTRSVLTLDVSELHRAADLMLEYDFRHVPITVFDEKLGKDVVAGVVSMRDLFAILVKSQKENLDPFQRSHVWDSFNPQIALISKDPKFLQLMRKALGVFMSAEVKPTRLSQEERRSTDLLVVDLDELEPSEWTRLLKAKNHDPAQKEVMVVFDPARHPATTIQVLEELGQAEKFWILKKPVDVLRVYEGLSRVKN